MPPLGANQSRPLSARVGKSPHMAADDRVRWPTSGRRRRFKMAWHR